MFHHFYDENHPQGQGAISSDEFEKILSWLESNFTILPPDEFIDGYLRKTLRDKRYICLTFDDSLLCQYEVALPVLESKNLTAFFNIYSSAFSGKPDPLEIFRYFRTVAFDSVENFYSKFFEHMKNTNLEIYTKGEHDFKKHENYLIAYPFYSTEDRKFRFFRDRILGKDAYISVMQNLIEIFNFDVSTVPEKVFMTKSQVCSLKKAGHKIGLHSDSHPTDIASLSKSVQRLEYSTNYSFLRSEFEIEADSMAHPCGSYNQDTVEILRDLEVRIGFASSLNSNKWSTEFEVPREDHMTILGLVEKK